MRIGCALIRHLPVQVERMGKTRERPLIIGGFCYEKKPVYDASEKAIRCGVKPGMLLNEAHVLCPEAEFLPLDERKYHQAYEQAIHVVENFSPLVEAEKMGCCFFDASGFEGELRLARHIIRSLLKHTGLKACLGIAGNKFLASLAANMATEKPLIIPEGDEASFLSPLPANLLPCSDDTKERLNLLGIRTISQLSSFSREMLVEQFGKEDGALVYRLSRGIDPRPLCPRTKPRLVSKSLQFDTPVDSSLQLLMVINRSLQELIPELRNKSQVCRRIRLSIVSSAATEKVTLDLKEPTNSHKAIMARIKSWLEKARFPEAIDGMGICLEVHQDRGKQLHLLKDSTRDTERLSALRRMGLKKVAITDEHALIPERRFKLTDI